MTEFKIDLFKSIRKIHLFKSFINKVDIDTVPEGEIPCTIGPLGFMAGTGSLADFREDARLLMGINEDTNDNDEISTPFIGGVPSKFMPPVSPGNLVDLFEAQVIKDVEALIYQKPQKNLTVDENKAMRDICSWEDTVVRAADKGGKIVLLSRSYYVAEAERPLLNNEIYLPLASSPLVKFKTELRSLLRRHVEAGVITRRKAERLLPEYPSKPHWYHIPKVHKSVIHPPGRPIVAGIGSLTEPLSQFIDWLLRPLLKDVPAYLKDTKSFLECIQNFEWQEHYSLASIDVESLYTKIPQKMGVEAIRQILCTTDKGQEFIQFVCESLEFILTHNAFMFLDDWYIQQVGTAMGTPVACTFANLFLALFEEKYVYSDSNGFLCHIKLYQRYIDDIVVIWDNTEEKFNEFVNHLNVKNEMNMAFTSVFGGRRLEFLDVLVEIKHDGICSLASEARLIEDIFSNYDKQSRPVKSINDIIEVKLKLTLTNLISLKEREETLTTNVWILITWDDYRLTWNESDYGGIDVVRVPYYMVWLPDIVLENNIDGQFEVAYYANVLVYSNGYMYWLPPAIFRSTCSVDVKYFPFDWQNCSLVFRSKTYNAKEVDLQLALDDEGVKKIEWVDIDPEAFTENGEWAIKHRPARKVINKAYTPEDVEYQEIRFYLIIQRKPLFYIINVIVPCVLISSLVVLVYFLPAKAGGQKCTVSISVLLAQTVFLFLIAQSVPETSLSVPLIGKWISDLCNARIDAHRSQLCHRPERVATNAKYPHNLTTSLKRMLLEVLPRYLHMEIAPCDETEETPRERRRSSLGIMLKAEEYVLKKPRSELMFERQRHRHGISRGQKERIAAPQNRILMAPICLLDNLLDADVTTTLYRNLAQCAPEIKTCVDACNFITASTKEQNATAAEMENWVMVGKVLDVLFFSVALPLFAVGTLAIFLMGHFNNAPDRPFAGDSRLYEPSA
ncbi:unnamed protein product [Ranitomeya imitator]|uniref:Uncharacterized protein n=1 Tax=Ranitomeya imitator TaxID=111125 RepID=A0ABN9LD19_9NEOB|nr:unnamed protein product [Ranitomeya imitator]